MSVSVLVEPGRVGWTSENGFSIESFLVGAKSQFDTFESIRSDWSPHTASWAVRALRAVYSTMRATGSGADKDQWLEWIRTATHKQAENLTQHLGLYHGATLLATNPTNTDVSTQHGYPLFTAHALSALRAASYILDANMIGALPAQTRKDLAIWARSELDRIVAQSVTGWVAPRDLINLPYHALTLCYLEQGMQPAMLAYVIRFVCQHQIKGGGWPLLGTEFTSDRGNRVFRLSSFEIGAALLRLSTFLQERMPDQNPDEQTIRRDAFRTLFELLRNSFVSVEVGGKEVTGWTTNHASPVPTVETWATALALRFLERLRYFTQSEVQSEVLARYETTIPFHMKSWVDWNNIDEPDSRVGIKAYLERQFLNKITYASPPSKEACNVSVIFFGPPGTSKTTLAKALAKKLGWPLVTVTPSLFLSNGTAGIDSHASHVFSDLRKLQEVVVLFDECDELFRARSIGEKNASSELDVVALITGAMLPRLQDLHDRGRLIFILATNRIDAIDSAVRRQGRFDHLIAVGPPDREGRERLLLSQGVSHEAAADLSHVLEGFTRDELMGIGSFVALSGQPEAQFEQMIAQHFGEETRVISKPRYEDFKKQRAMFCSALRNAQSDNAQATHVRPGRKRGASKKGARRS